MLKGLKSHLEILDVVYMTRIQDEWGGNGEYHDFWVSI